MKVYVVVKGTAEDQGILSVWNSRLAAERARDEYPHQGMHPAVEEHEVGMTYIKQPDDHANWFCTYCGARGSGDGAAYERWLDGHTCYGKTTDTATVRLRWDRHGLTV